MKTAGISGLVRVKRGKTTIRVPGVRVADDLVERQFRPSADERANAAESELAGIATRAGADISGALRYWPLRSAEAGQLNGRLSAHF
jgi:hypothetical protein